MNDSFPHIYHLFNTALVGIPVTKTQNSIGSMIQIGLGDRRESFDSKGRTYSLRDWSISVEMASWRLTHNGAYLVGSRDDQSLIQEGIEKLLNTHFESLLVTSKFLDVQFTFTGGYQLTTFFDTMEENQWDIYGKEIFDPDYGYPEGIKKAQSIASSLPILDTYRPLSLPIVGARFWAMTFSEESETFHFEKDTLLHLYCSWRLEKGGDYILGSYDSANLKHNLTGLIGRRLQQVEIANEMMDARFHFEGGYILTTFSSLRRYFQWVVTMKEKPQFSAEITLT